MWVFIGLTVLIVWLTHWFLSNPHNYWKNKGVPGPKPTLIVGNIGSIITFTDNPGVLYKKIYDEFKDYLYVGYYKLRQPGIILRDMELVKDVLVKQFSSFHDNDLHVDEDIDPLFGKNPFCLKGDKWKHVRSLITSSITHSKVRSMFTIINSVGESMSKYLKSKSKESLQCLNVKELAEMFTTDCVASCAFGLDGKSFEDPEAEFKAMGQKFSTPTIWMTIKHFATFIFPSLGKIFQVKMLPDKLESYFISILTNAIDYRQKKNILRNDYLDLLLSLKNKSKNYDFQDIDVMAQAATFYIDGYETSSVAIAYVLYELAANPHVQNKLRKEIRDSLDQRNGELTYDNIQEISYLDQVVSESMRKNPPLSFMVRVCTKQINLVSPKADKKEATVNIEPGTLAVIPVLAIHYDPTHYPEPNKFDPERFTQENIEARAKYTYLPFGEGPRICLGFKFGITQTKCAIIHILTHYKISVNKKTQEPLQINPSYFITSPIGGIWLDFEEL